ncbi:MAG: hypothetical protein SFY32_15995 [Bacteroidota bacterium]|nr:hypothetical protein [Bacteroidota bacterium]
MKRIIELIAPKICGTVLAKMSPILDKAREKSNEEFYNVFLEQILENKVAVYFDDKVSLEELNYNLRTLIIDNHINVDTIANDFNENEGADGMLGIAAKTFRKQGWAICDFDSDPKIYYLSIVPISSQNELSKFVKENGLFVQFF